MTDYLRNLAVVARAPHADPAAKVRAEWQLRHLAHVSDKPIKLEALAILAGIGKTYDATGDCSCPSCFKPLEPQIVRKMDKPIDSPSKPEINIPKPVLPKGFRAAKNSYVYTET